MKRATQYSYALDSSEQTVGLLHQQHRRYRDVCKEVPDHSVELRSWYFVKVSQAAN